MSPSTSTGQISSLPAEVLLDIFQEYLKPGPVLHLQGSECTLPALTPKDIEYIPGRGENSPFVIDQVCGTWRQLARGDSRLYTDIHVVNPTPKDVSRVRTMLRLSKDRPLRVFLEVHQDWIHEMEVTPRGFVKTNHPVAWHRIMKLVFDNAHRVEQLYLQIPLVGRPQTRMYADALRVNINWDALAFPALTTLHFHDEVHPFYMPEMSFYKDLLTRACATSTRLTDIRLDPTFTICHISPWGPDDGLSPGASMIPWKNLTSLTISVDTWKEMMAVLRQCPLLQELYMQSRILDSEDRVWEPVSLPSLWSLVIEGDECITNYFQPLLYLKAPALKSLSLQHPTGRCIFPHYVNVPSQSKEFLAALTAFHRLNPECRIHTFSSFQRWGPRDLGYLQILSHPVFEDLRSFKTNDVVGEKTLKWMTWDKTSNDPPVLPKLHTFSAHVKANDGVLSRMVASRVLDAPQPVLTRVRAVLDKCSKYTDLKEDREWANRLRPSMVSLEYIRRCPSHT
ncbi:hypothetical protein CC1G_11424 [Coprinopsis cinerea okayama7|uniref:F-box domain-containing protein n=1 Tax=Coprinopsis cinerea (strain Okayama-7 / 130 / ATCC MYA-4618 / FGSC 9003) TaxID=240176 RepID=A8N493_COPC7|nr:hypothetical protein CC1G_11424 [Coprinopsis cinerea okayama7\|eukprot:XP_001829688.1 hypothetical protein CC1G_11424 [Coprinopsis cinerea okayama7\